MRTIKSFLMAAIGLGAVMAIAAPAAAIGPAAIAGATVGGLALFNAGQNPHHGNHSQFPTLGQSIHGAGHGGHAGHIGHSPHLGQRGFHPQRHGGHHPGHFGVPGFRTDFFTGAPVFGPSGNFGPGSHPGFHPGHGAGHGAGRGPVGFGGNCRTVTDTITNPAGRPSLVRYATCMDAFGRPQFVPGSLIVHETF